MNNTKLEQCVNKSAKALVALVMESEEEIATAIQDTLEQASRLDMETGQASKVKFNISHKLCLDLTGNKQTDSISFSVLHKNEKSSPIEDPNQDNLNLGD